jgi:hypothetical protein
VFSADAEAMIEFGGAKRTSPIDRESAHDKERFVEGIKGRI